MSRSFAALCRLPTVFIKKLWITRKWPSEFENVRICEEGKSEVLKEKPSDTAGGSLRSRCRFLFFVGRARNAPLGERRSPLLFSPCARASSRFLPLPSKNRRLLGGLSKGENKQHKPHTMSPRDLILAHFNGRRVLASLHELSDLAFA